MTLTTEPWQLEQQVGRDELLIDRYLPEYDFTIVEFTKVEAPAPATWKAARGLDFLTVRSPLINAAMFVRSLPARFGRAEPDETPEAMTLDGIVAATAEGEGADGWVALGEQPGREFVFGAVGKFWQTDIEWRTVLPYAWSDFDEPGWGQLAANFLVQPYGGWRSTITYEARTALYDAESRRRFKRYWTVVRPFIGSVMRGALRTIAADAVAMEKDRRRS